MATAQTQSRIPPSLGHALKIGLDGAYRDCAVAFAVLVTVFGAYVLSPIKTPFDSRWTIHTAVSILHRGDTNLDEYDADLRADDYYAIERRDGHARVWGLGPTCRS